MSERAARTCDCRACRNDWSILSGIEKERLSKIKTSPDDGPAHELAGDLDADGMIRFRPATMGDQLDRLIARWIWDATVEGE